MNKTTNKFVLTLLTCTALAATTLAAPRPAPAGGNRQSATQTCKREQRRAPEPQRHDHTRHCPAPATHHPAPHHAATPPPPPCHPEGPDHHDDAGWAVLGATAAVGLVGCLLGALN